MKDLSPERIQRINAKVAELCGWKRAEVRAFWNTKVVPIWHTPQDKSVATCPNYWQSLDACAEFEQSHIVGKLNEAYREALAAPAREFDANNGDCLDEAAYVDCCIFATASQRVTAFLAIHNLTIEEI